MSRQNFTHGMGKTPRVPLSRRQVLKGAVGVAATWQLPLVQALTLSPVSHGKAATRPRRAVYQDMPYLDFSGYGQGYVPPRGNAATRDHLATLSDQQRQILHYFS